MNHINYETINQKDQAYLLGYSTAALCVADQPTIQALQSAL